MRKYEIYLPLKYNDGRDIEPEKYRQVKVELSAYFGGITMSPMAAPFEGTWIQHGIEYRDVIIKVEIVAADDEKIERFFRDYKETLKEVFQQHEVLITVQEIRTL